MYILEYNDADYWYCRSRLLLGYTTRKLQA